MQSAPTKKALAAPHHEVGAFSKPEARLGTWATKDNDARGNVNTLFGTRTWRSRDRVKGARWKGFEIAFHPSVDTANDRRKRRLAVLGMDKVRRTLKQLVRLEQRVGATLQYPLHPDIILV